MTAFEVARQKYRPQIIKYLLVAETPPKTNSNRFFYFEKVDNGDSLFIQTMKTLYPKLVENLITKDIRKIKSKLLLQFQTNGFYLIDSLDQPFEEKYSPTQKIKLLNAGQLILLEKIKSISNENTKVILISATVFRANYDYLKNNGVNVINREFIDFPGSGGQKNYRNKMKELNIA